MALWMLCVQRKEPERRPVLDVLQWALGDLITEHWVVMHDTNHAVIVFGAPQPPPLLKLREEFYWEEVDLFEIASIVESPHVPLEQAARHVHGRDSSRSQRSAAARPKPGTRNTS